MSMWHWRDEWVDDNGQKHDLRAYPPRKITFSEIVRYIGISRMTLMRHRVSADQVDPKNMDGILVVYTDNNTMTRTDWLDNWMKSRRKNPRREIN